MLPFLDSSLVYLIHSILRPDPGIASKMQAYSDIHLSVLHRHPMACKTRRHLSIACDALPHLPPCHLRPVLLSSSISRRALLFPQLTSHSQDIPFSPLKKHGSYTSVPLHILFPLFRMPFKTFFPSYPFSRA